MLTGSYLSFYNKISNSISPKRLFHDPLNTLAFGTDASFYRLIPKLVIKAISEDEVALILKEAKEFKLPVTFRAAGTSLSGQAISDSILVVTAEGWKNYKIDEAAGTITLQPGVVGAYANKVLSPFLKKIGPDPASINSAMIGGIAANNASGMCCGTAQNSYNTLYSMKIVFADGCKLDTSSTESVQEFRKSHKNLLNSIYELSQRIKENLVLSERISRKYKMKNTTGYSINALVDFSDPIDIIQHLMIGSEGSLGFISEITYKTVPDFPNRASALCIFPDIESACEAVRILKTAPVDAVELMDRISLRSVEDKPGMPAVLKELGPLAAALLVETRSANKFGLDKNIVSIISSLHTVSLLYPVKFTSVPVEFTKLWNIRKGLFPSVGAIRKPGTTVIIEDIVFPLDKLSNAVSDLRKLFDKHNYSDAIIFGHALEGNLHFVFTQNFNSEIEVNRYKDFMADIAELVVAKYDGSLKAEHGTGRNMAPFVEYEWGKEAYQLMKEIKNVFDPENLLNPGVIINSDHNAHIKNLKPLPIADDIIDKCIECGFCEVNCVSNDFTLSPRQRISVYREIMKLKDSGSDPSRLAELNKLYTFNGDATCATDGLCSLACPVNINTGVFIKKLRHTNHSLRGKKVASFIARNMKTVTASARVGLNFVNFAHQIFGTGFMSGASKTLRKISGGNIPLWNKYMPKGADRISICSASTPDNPKVVYFPSCINRSMGISSDYSSKDSLVTVTIRLLEKAGYNIVFPDNLDSLCCGMAFASKGFTEAGDLKAEELELKLLKCSNNGEFPVLVDMSPCLYRMKETFSTKIKLYDPTEFIINFAADKLKFTPKDDNVLLHITCSSKKMELEEKLLLLAKRCVNNVELVGGNCCGFAGDKGFNLPELNDHGLRHLQNTNLENISAGYSTSRTCEIGLSLHSGKSFKSILYLVDETTN